MINLDIVRIFAALLVLGIHIGQHAGFDFSVGSKGVQLFFILSGYLAMCSLSKNDSAQIYYRKRIKKIVPTYYICLVIIWLKDFMLNIYKGVSIGELIGINGICGIKFIRYFLFLQVIVPTTNWNLWGNRGGTWTMSTFAVFYAFAPFLFKKVNSFKKSVLFFLILMIGTPYMVALMEKGILSFNFPSEAHIEYFVGCHPIAGMCYFVGGMVIYYACIENKVGQLLFGVITTLVVTKGTWYQYELLFIVLVTTMISAEPIIKNDLLCDCISTISKSTFTLYLIHPVVLDVAPYLWKLTDKKATGGIYALYLLLASILGTWIVQYFIKKIKSGNVCRCLRKNK